MVRRVYGKMTTSLRHLGRGPKAQVRPLIWRNLVPRCDSVGLRSARSGRMPGRLPEL